MLKWPGSRRPNSYPAQSRDYQPYITDIAARTEKNDNYRTVLWTGARLQVTLMSIPAGGDIGLEMHGDTDQFIRIQQGRAVVRMGQTKDNLTFVKDAGPGYAVMIPQGTWHNIINTGQEPLKLYSIYAPPHHPRGTVQPTKPPSGH